MAPRSWRLAVVVTLEAGSVDRKALGISKDWDFPEKRGHFRRSGELCGRAKGERVRRRRLAPRKKPSPEVKNPVVPNEWHRKVVRPAVSRSSSAPSRWVGLRMVGRTNDDRRSVRLAFQRRAKFFLKFLDFFLANARLALFVEGIGRFVSLCGRSSRTNRGHAVARVSMGIEAGLHAPATIFVPALHAVAQASHRREAPGAFTLRFAAPGRRRLRGAVGPTGPLAGTAARGGRSSGGYVRSAF